MSIPHDTTPFREIPSPITVGSLVDNALEPDEWGVRRREVEAQGRMHAPRITIADAVSQLISEVQDATNESFMDGDLYSIGARITPADGKLGKLGEPLPTAYSYHLQLYTGGIWNRKRRQANERAWYYSLMSGYPDEIPFCDEDSPFRISYRDYGDEGWILEREFTVTVDTFDGHKISVALDLEAKVPEAVVEYLTVRGYLKSTTEETTRRQFTCVKPAASVDDDIPF